MKGLKKNKKSKKKVIIFSLLLLCFLGIILVVGLYKIYYPKIFNSRISNITKLEKEEIFSTDIVGWLQVEGTNIDYPVVYNSMHFDVGNVYDNDFLWTNVNNKKVGNRMFILGHNILNVSSQPLITDKDHTRFEQLMSFVYYDFAKKHEYVQFSINNHNYLYKIFSVSFVKSGDLDYDKNSYKKSELDKYIKSSIKNSFYKYNIEVNSDDKIISLVTCTRMFGYDSKYMFKIDARMVRDGEVRRKYNVDSKKNYQKILKNLEGDEKDVKTKA